MGRLRIFEVGEIPVTVTRVVVALCADYERRAKLMREMRVSGRRLDASERILLESCETYNAVIDRALEGVEDGLRADLLSDLAAGRGFTRSRAQGMMSKNAYYRRRRKIILEVARGIGLL